MQTSLNFETCFSCCQSFKKAKLYKDWESYEKGIFQLSQETNLWRCINCRPFVSSFLIGKKLERIQENTLFSDFQQEEDEMYT